MKRTQQGVLFWKRDKKRERKATTDIGWVKATCSQARKWSERSTKERNETVLFASWRATFLKAGNERTNLFRFLYEWNRPLPKLFRFLFGAYEGPRTVQLFSILYLQSKLAAPLPWKTYSSLGTREYQFDMGRSGFEKTGACVAWTVNSRRLCNLPKAYVLLRLACGNHSGSTATSLGQHAGRVVQKTILERTPRNRGNGSHRLCKTQLPSPPLKRLNARDPSTASL